MQAAIRIDSNTAAVYPEGWQSWTPTTIYPAGAEQHRPVDARHATLGYRPEAASRPGIVGAGLLALRPALGEPVQLIATESPWEVPSIWAALDGAGCLRWESDGPVVHFSADTDDLPTALTAWARAFAVASSCGPIRPTPRVWCSWYHYFTGVTEADIDENLAAMHSNDLPIDVVQIDDGYQREIGDWTEPSGRFDSLAELVARIRNAGRRAGIWLAPFLVGDHSRVAAEHPDWLVAGADAGWNWDQQLHGLDVANPAVLAHLESVVEHFAGMGIDYFKLDFLYAGALGGSMRSHRAAIAAYRTALRTMREAAGADAIFVACGAPTLASVGLVDAMRVSPDTAPYLDPGSGDFSSPGQRCAMLTGHARQWQNRTLWTNDPDCLLARPEVALRQRWADYVTAVGGLRSVSDRIEALDEWGLATTRQYLA